MASEAALYQKKIGIICGAQIGGIKVFLKLTVDDDGDVFGAGTFDQSGTQAGEVPLRIVSGVVHHTGFGTDHVLVALQGQYAIPFGPPPLIGHIDCLFMAALVLDRNWKGTGIIHYGPFARSVCRDAKVAPLIGK